MSLVREYKLQTRGVPLLPVYEVLIGSFVHRGGSVVRNCPAFGVLTGGNPLHCFTVDERHGRGDLYYFVYDASVTRQSRQGKRSVSVLDLVLVKAQIGLEGYIPNLNSTLDSTVRLFAGYTRFTSSMIHRTGT
jgi:hypothetical protein